MAINKLQTLARKLNYDFKDYSLLSAALTHRSVRGDNNERLEFLGDSILNFIIAEVLYHKYPKAKEGQLSRLRSALVKGDTLAKLANKFEISQYLRLGAGEIKSGGAFRSSILADSVEAIIAAIYIDGGFEVCKQQVLGWFDKLLDSVSGKELKDPKTRLQELLQASKYPLPQYTILDVEGEAHAQTFYVECSVEGMTTVTRGSGTSRRKAEQDAALQFLVTLDK